MHYRIDQSINQQYQKTAKQNSLNCIWEALANTHTLNFKIHKNLQLDGGVIFDTFANSNESHADVVFISALECSI